LHRLPPSDFFKDSGFNKQRNAVMSFGILATILSFAGIAGLLILVKHLFF